MDAEPDTIAIRRVRDVPVVEAGSVPGYGAIFNPGLFHHDGRYHLFARGVREGYRRNPGEGPRFLDYISDVLVFTSDDGIDYEFEYVLAKAGDHGVHCYEDPRVQEVHSPEGTHIVMTYTNLPPAGSGLPWRIGAHRLRYENERFELDGESGRLLGPDGYENKDAVLFNLTDGRVALIHRIPPNIQVAVFDHLDLLWDAEHAYWESHVEQLDHHTIIRPDPTALGVGAGAPPVPTDAGLLLFFHERRGDGTYTMNVALLDPDTGRVRSALVDPLLVPELEWERVGDVDEVVFVQGAHRVDEDTIYLTYGAADRCIGAATVSIAGILTALRAA